MTHGGRAWDIDPEEVGGRGVPPPSVHMLTVQVARTVYSVTGQYIRYDCYVNDRPVCYVYSCVYYFV